MRLLALPVIGSLFVFLVACEPAAVRHEHYTTRVSVYHETPGIGKYKYYYRPAHVHVYKKRHYYYPYRSYSYSYHHYPARHYYYYMP